LPSLSGTDIENQYLKNIIKQLAEQGATLNLDHQRLARESQLEDELESKEKLEELKEELGIDENTIGAAAATAARFPFGKKGIEMDMNGRPVNFNLSRKRGAASSGWTYDFKPAKRHRAEGGFVDFMETMTDSSKGTQK
jgi:hypothetical protein